MQAAEVRAKSPVDYIGSLEFVQHRHDAARFDPFRFHNHGVSMARVAHPDWLVVPTRLDGTDEFRQGRFNVLGTKTGDQSDTACTIRLVQVESVKKSYDFTRRSGRTDLDADGVAQAAHEFDVGTVELAGAFTSPEECGGGAVATARQGALIREEKSFMGAEDGLHKFVGVVKGVSGWRVYHWRDDFRGVNHQQRGP